MEENKKEKKKRIIINSIRIIFIIVLILSLLNILNWYKNNQETENIMDEISSAVVVEVIEENKTEELKEEQNNKVIVDINTKNESNDTDIVVQENIVNEIEQVEEIPSKEKKYQIDFEYLKSQNPDIVGWIKVEGTKIEYPVVKSSDNTYYLNHNLYKNKSKAGWVFADYRNKIDETDKNIIIYGHNRRNESMFGTLKNVFSSSWYTKEENRNIIFITENDYSVYRTFSIYQTQNPDDSYYITTDFYDLEYEKFLENIKNRSVVDFKENINTNQTLTLSTCTDNSKYRIVLHAQKIENQ